MDDSTTRKNSVLDSGIAAGVTLSDRYEIVELVGQGGMGTVYKARHLLIGNDVAVKVMHPHLLNDAASLERFKSEAKAAMSLRHERLMAVSDYGTTPSGQPFIVMEFVQGKGLDALLDEQKYLSLEEFFEIFVQVCEGLSHAHDRGIVHRDIKPSNIMLTRTEHEKWSVRIVDFGIAKVLPKGEGAVQHLTQTGEIFGSPLYMSPEQCKGKDVDARSDIYSLGCVMFEALTGSPPHQGESAIETLMLHVNEKAPKLIDRRAEIGESAELEKIVASALANMPASRYQTISHLKSDLLQRKFTGSLLKEPVNQGKSADASSVTAISRPPLTAMQTFKSTFLSPLLIIVAAAATVWLINSFGITQPRVVITGNTSAQDLREAELEFQLAKDKMAQGFISEAAEYSQKALDSRAKNAPDSLLLAESMNQRADISLRDAEHESLLLKGHDSSSVAEPTTANRIKRIANDYSSAESLLKDAVKIADATTSGADKAVSPVRFRGTLVTAYLDQGKYQDAESTLNEISQLYLGHQPADKADPAAVQRTFHELFDSQYERLYWGTDRALDAAKIRLAHRTNKDLYDPTAVIEDSVHPFSGVWSSGNFLLDLKQEGRALSGQNEIRSLSFDKEQEHRSTVSGSVDGNVAHLTFNLEKGRPTAAVAVRVGNVLVFHLLHSDSAPEEAYVPENAILSAASTKSVEGAPSVEPEHSEKDTPAPSAAVES